MSKQYDTQRERIEFPEYIRRHTEPATVEGFAPKGFLFLGLSTISFIGLFTICRFLPMAWGFPFIGFFMPLRVFIPLTITLGIIGGAFKLHSRQTMRVRYLRDRTLKAETDFEDARKSIYKSLLFLLYMDRNLWDKVYNGDTAFYDYPYDTPCTKNIALGMILQKLRELDSSKEIARKALADAIDSLEEQMKFYRMLQKLDSLILKHIPDGIRSEYEKEVYALRYNLLKFVLDAAEKEEFFRFDYDDDADRYYIKNYYDLARRTTEYRWKDKPIIDFFTMILNEFLKDDFGYDEEYHEFDRGEFEYYFRHEKATGVLVTNDLQESIAAYEKAIAELEENIADFRVQAHDLQILLDVFYAEYNSRVGMLYAKLDRIKLNIKEYRKRLKLAAGKSITEERAEKIDEKIDELFSRAREKVDDLEDEAAEASEEYERYREEEEETSNFGAEFLEDLKELFRKLVFRYHPDMAENEEQKKEFHSIFIKIREAYEKRNMETLQEYVKKAEIEAESEDETLEEKLERLEKEYERLRVIFENLQAGLERMTKSELNCLRERVEEERSEGGNLLQELADAAEEEIETRKAELDELIRYYNKLIAQAV